MRNKLYTVRLEICMTKDQKKALESEAKKKQVTNNQLIREMIDIFCVT